MKAKSIGVDKLWKWKCIDGEDFVKEKSVGVDELGNGKDLDMKNKFNEIVGDNSQNGSCDEHEEISEIKFFWWRIS